MNLLLFLTSWACLFCSLKADDKNDIEDARGIKHSRKHIHNTFSPKYHHITTNVCNTSLISSIEDESLRYKNCKCDEQNGDVDCSHLGITELPKLISFTNNFHVVTFRKNKITNLEAETFFNGGNVTDLDLSHNRIDFISKTSFRNFKELVRLDLSHNLIWNIPKDVFANLVNLKELYLNFNNLIFLSSEHLKDLVELKALSLKSNPIQDLTYRNFENLGKLEFLNLESTMLTELPGQVFVFTPKLRMLYLADNRLTKVPSDSLYPLEHLKILDLSRNPIRIIYSQAFKGLDSLVTLKLSNMSSLIQIQNHAFGDMMRLQELHCSNNLLLHEIASDAFVEKSTRRKVPLPSLFLEHNGLRSLPEGLLNWNNNVELHLIGNPFHCDCHVTWMLNAQMQNHFQKHARCFSPAKFANVALSDLKDYELTCVESEDLSDVILICILAILFMLALILTISLFVWNRNCRRQKEPSFHKMDKNIMNDISIDYYGGDDFV